MFSNKIFTYVFLRYFFLAIQMATSLIIAGKVGTYFLGIWAFINLVTMFVSKLDFGLIPSTNVMFSKRDNKRDQKSDYYNASLTLFVICVLIFLIGICLFSADIYILKKYEVNDLYVVIMMNASLFVFQSFYIVMLRLIGFVKYSVIIQGLVIVAVFMTIVFSQESEMIVNAIISQSIGLILGLALAMVRLYRYFGGPDRLRLVFPDNSLPQFLYGISVFYLPLMYRFLLSENMSVNLFGLFSLAYTLSNIINIFLGSISTLVFPKSINKLKGQSVSKSADIVFGLNKRYLLVFSVLFLLSVMPVRILIRWLGEPFNQFILYYFVLVLMALMRYIGSGFVAYLMLKKSRILLLAKYSVILLVISAVFVQIARSFDFHFTVVSVSFIVFTAIFSVNLIRGAKLMLETRSYVNFYRGILLSYLLPLSLLMMLTYLGYFYVGYIISLIVFVLVNVDDLRLILIDFSRIRSNQNILDVNL
jgi:O-antigen/teichoic acid export membrane protein